MMRLHQDDPTADWTVPGVYEVDVGLYRIPLPLEHDSSLWADPDDWLDAPDEIKLDSMTWQMHPTPGIPAVTSCSRSPSGRKAPSPR